jgi:hypothetical protein
VISPHEAKSSSTLTLRATLSLICGFKRLSFLTAGFTDLGCEAVMQGPDASVESLSVLVARRPSAIVRIIKPMSELIANVSPVTPTTSNRCAEHFGTPVKTLTGRQLQSNGVFRFTSLITSSQPRPEGKHIIILSLTFTPLLDTLLLFVLQLTSSSFNLPTVFLAAFHSAFPPGSSSRTRNQG